VSNGSRELYTRDGFGNQVVCLRFTSDGKSLLAAGSNGALKVWDAQTGEEQKSIEADRIVTRVAAISADGKLVAWSEFDRSGRGGYLLRVVDIQTGKDKFTRQAHSSTITDLAFSGDGKALLSAARDRSCKIWNPESGQLLYRVRGPQFVSEMVAFNPAGSRILTGTLDGKVNLLRVPFPLQERLTVNAQLSRPTQIAFSPDGQSLFLATQTGGLHTLDARTGQERLGVAIGVVQHGNFSPDGKSLITTGPQSLLQIWDTATGEETLSLTSPIGRVSGAWFDPDGLRVVVAGEKAVHVLDAWTGKELCTFNGHATVATTACFSPDGKTVVSCGLDRRLRLWDAQTGEHRAMVTLPMSSTPVSRLCFSPDGTRIVAGQGIFSGASAEPGAELKVWDARLEKEVASIKLSGSRIDSVCFSPDGKLILTGGSDGVVRLWDLQTKCEMLALPGHGAGVVSVCFSPDGDTIASTSLDGTAKLWSAKPRP
jgi:WD40 repeat protein